MHHPRVLDLFDVFNCFQLHIQYCKCFWLGPDVLPCPAWERARYPDLGRTCGAVNEKQGVHKLNSRQHGTSNRADAFKHPCGFIWTDQMPTRTKLPIYTYLLASFDQINLPTYTTGASKVYNLFLFPLRSWIKNNRVIVKAIYKETLETPSSHLYNAKATWSPQLPQNPPDSRIHSLKALIKFGSSWRKINLI